MNWTWADIGTELLVEFGSSALRLRQNGWQALVALVCGPRYVISVPALYDSVQQSADTDAGTGRKRVLVRYPSSTERAAIASDMNSYLAEYGVAPAPADSEWVLWCPPGASGQSLIARLNARSAVPPFVTEEERTDALNALIAEARKMLP